MKQPRSLSEIARDIEAEFSEKKAYQYARPYIEAMGSLNKITDQYGADDARSIVVYALANMTGLRGGNAKALKQELKEILEAK